MEMNRMWKWSNRSSGFQNEHMLFGSGTSTKCRRIRTNTTSFHPESVLSQVPQTINQTRRKGHHAMKIDVHEGGIPDRSESESETETGNRNQKQSQNQGLK